MWYKKKKKINWNTMETPEEFLARGGKVNHIKKDNRKFLSPEDRAEYEYNQNTQKKDASKFDPKNVSFDIRSKFYETQEWKSLRYKFIKNKKTEELVCTQCNKGPFTKENWSDMNVDHIKPVKHFWEERLNMSNLQILCSICNRVKLNYYKEPVMLGDGAKKVLSTMKKKVKG
jgi:5-methylcytosine-specific restriction endonuclease McrA